MNPSPGCQALLEGEGNDMEMENRGQSGPSEERLTQTPARYVPPTLTKSGHMAAVTQKSGVLADGGSPNLRP